MTGPGRIWVDVTGISPGSDAAVYADRLCEGFARIGVDHALCCRDPGLRLFAWPALRQTDEVAAPVARMAEMSRFRMMADRLPAGTRRALARFVQLQRAALAARRAPRKGASVMSDAAEAVPDAVTPASGDVLLMLGPYGDASRFLERGVRLVALLAETVPLVRPDWLDAYLRDAVAHWRRSTLPVLSGAIAVGSRDAMALGTAALPTIIPAAATYVETSGPLAGASMGRFILATAPIGVAGSTRQLLLAWRRLEQQVPRERLPKLVLAGEPGPLAEDVMLQISNSLGMGGQVIVVPSPTPTLRSALMRECLFCVAPAPGGGWGRADLDAAAVGKACLSEIAVEEGWVTDTLNAAALAGRIRDQLEGGEVVAVPAVRGWDDVARDVAAAVLDR
jgi:hypothetical protein